SKLSDNIASSSTTNTRAPRSDVILHLRVWPFIDSEALAETRRDMLSRRFVEPIAFGADTPSPGIPADSDGPGLVIRTGWAPPSGRIRTDSPYYSGGRQIAILVSMAS